MPDVAKLVLRLTVGLLILLHGISKIQGGPGFILDIVEKAGLPDPFGYLVYVREDQFERATLHERHAGSRWQLLALDLGSAAVENRLSPWGARPWGEGSTDGLGWSHLRLRGGTLYPRTAFGEQFLAWLKGGFG